MVKITNDMNPVVRLAASALPGEKKYTKYYHVIRR